MGSKRDAKRKRNKHNRNRKEIELLEYFNKLDEEYKNGTYQPIFRGKPPTGKTKYIKIDDELD